jgi:hypothetical protein
VREKVRERESIMKNGMPHALESIKAAPISIEEARRLAQDIERRDRWLLRDELPAEDARRAVEQTLSR